MELTYENAETVSPGDKKQNWQTAFGLQAVDNLKPSEYAVKLSEEHISGKMSIYQVEDTIERYYKQKGSFDAKNRQNEADIVSARIVKILGNKSFSLNENSLKNIHKILFKDFKNYNPGKYRKMDIIKAEWVLDNDTVQYAHFENIEDEIALILNKEEQVKKIDINHILNFISKIWQVHPFLEGNTRTVAIFAIQYLRNLGYKIDNSSFEKHAKFFRNALVRSNYRNAVLNINRENAFLINFFENVLQGKEHKLQNRELHIHWKFPSGEG
ncbi:MAG: Fic family protein [Fibromonadaceae bacterium]|jgi:fido (protein-threonine AMPylation protein)|nr:Fic family protein [Fibromonadaceae bacterium]